MGANPTAEIAHAQVADRWAAAWSAQDMDRVAAALASVVTDDCLYEDVTLAAVNHGKEELQAFGRLFVGGVPDFKVEVTKQFAADDLLGVEWTMSGTHRHDLPNMPATGRRFEVRGASVFELEGDRIKRCRDYWDMATLLTQLGLMPAR
jgi:steroid delta-isomerase-like uncharacterized protein